MRSAEYGLNMNVIGFNMRGVLFLLFFLVFLIFVVVVRLQCVKIGYDLSELDRRVSNKKIEHQYLFEKVNNLKDKERLYELGKKHGLNLSEINKVYYVE